MIPALAKSGFGPSLGSLGSLKANFFDRGAVQSAADRASRRVLSKLGAFVRQRAKTSMRTKKGPSKPGQPPHAHKGTLKKLLFFAFDPTKKSVVVGPLLFGRSRFGVATELNEYGGSVPGGGRVAWIANAVGRNNRGQFVTGGKTRVELTGSVNYPARPFMRPALAAEQPKLPALLHNSVR